MPFYSFHNSFVVNSASENNPNKWKSDCLSIVSTLESDTFVLCSECKHENVPFVDPEQSRQLFKLDVCPGSYFSAISDSKLSSWLVDQITFLPIIIPYDVTVLPEILSRYKFVVYSESSDFISLPLSTPCGSLAADSDSLWTDRTQFKNNSNEGYTFLPTKANMSVQHLSFVDSNSFPAYSLPELTKEYKSDASLHNFLLSSSLCVKISSAGSSLSFPARYINYGPSYIQIISGRIAFNGINVGNLVFSWNYSTNELITEIALDSFRNMGTNLQKDSIHYRVHLDPSHIYLYSDH